MTEWNETADASKVFSGKTRGTTYSYEVQAQGLNGEWSASTTQSRRVPTSESTSPPPSGSPQVTSSVHNWYSCDNRGCRVDYTIAWTNMPAGTVIYWRIAGEGARGTFRVHHANDSRIVTAYGRYQPHQEPDCEAWFN